MLRTEITGRYTMNSFQDIRESIKQNFDAAGGLCDRCTGDFPGRDAVKEIIRTAGQLLFPVYFGDTPVLEINRDRHMNALLEKLNRQLYDQVFTAIRFDGTLSDKAASDRAGEICDSFLNRLPAVHALLIKDIDVAFEGDPAAQSKADIILSYPGFFAMFVHRIAHELYLSRVPFVPRLMSEYAHGKTGIDINPGACIGEYFFMDHGTGIVIGETTTIGSHVKVYQGVTLGALSTHLGQQMSGVKRHPTIEDNVTIYSNASILGGNTIIGHDSVIGGGVFITDSVPAGTLVRKTAD